MCYQIVVRESKGSRLHDIDGNEYIDLLNCFGPNFLGHSADAVQDALQKQIESGYELGPQSPIAGQTAELFCRLTGNERASFVNTGSEAVQSAMRLARTVTGRDKIVVFDKDYHGNFDEVLVRGVTAGQTLRTLPSAPGIPRRAVDDILVLEYGSDQSLQLIKQHGDEIAAVLVEPVQGRRPEIQPAEFLLELREITSASGSLLVFDEVITGLRTGPGGAQAWFGVQADIATYGKVAGGGMPIGIVAGKAEYMDTFDGGHWEYDDDSFPDKPVTFFAGTFVRHPMALAAAKVTLEFLINSDASLWDNLRSKANRLAHCVDAFFVEHNFPFRMPNFGSQLFVRVLDDDKYANLLFFHLREKGVFMLESFPSYVTLAHTDEEIDYMISAFKQSALELHAAGFFPHARVDPNALAEVEKPVFPQMLSNLTFYNAASEESDEFSGIPATNAQTEIFIASSISGDANCSFNEPAVLEFKGDLDADKLSMAAEELVGRHESLRCRFSDCGEFFYVDEKITCLIPLIDLTDRTDKEASISQYMVEEASIPFDLSQGPLIRFRLYRLDASTYRLLILAHHIICDGTSFHTLVNDLGALYSQDAEYRGTSLDEAPSFIEFAWEQYYARQSLARHKAREYWLQQYSTELAASEVPTRTEQPDKSVFNAAMRRRRISTELIGALRKSGAKHGATLYATLFSAYGALLHRVCDKDELSIGLLTAGQAEPKWNELVGDCVEMLPFRSRIDFDTGFDQYLGQTRRALSDAIHHREFGYGEIRNELKASGAEPHVEFLINVERMDTNNAFSGLDVSMDEGTRCYTTHLIYCNVIESPDHVELLWTFNTECFSPEVIECWMAQFEQVLHRIGTDVTCPIKSLPMSFINDVHVDTSLLANVCEVVSNDLLPIHTLFQSQAKATPDAQAVCSSAVNLSYAELASMAAILARSLINEGVKPGDTVGIALDHSAHTIACVLGVLMAGAAYAPVDPTRNPRQKLDVLKAAQVKLVLVANTDNLISDSTDISVLSISDDTFQYVEKAVDPLPECSAGSIAFVCVKHARSGPHEVERFSHRSVSRMSSVTNHSNNGERDTNAFSRMLCWSELNRDISLFEIWAPLMSGGAIVIPETPSFDSMVAAVKQFDISALWLDAMCFRLVVDEYPEVLSQVKQLWTDLDTESGIAVMTTLNAPDTCELLACTRHKGNAMFTSVQRLSAETTQVERLGIGEPIWNSGVLVLDRHGNIAPVGVDGILHVYGDGLSESAAAVSVNSADVSAADRFQTVKGQLLLATDHFCRYTVNGDIVFIRDKEDHNNFRQLTYWKQQRAQVTESLHLPLMNSTGPQIRYESGTTTMELSVENMPGLLRARAAGTEEMFRLFHAVFSILLYRYCQQNQFTVEALVYQPPTSQKQEQKNGICVGSLPLHVTVPKGASYAQLRQSNDDICNLALHENQKVISAVLADNIGGVSITHSGASNVGIQLIVDGVGALEIDEFCAVSNFDVVEPLEPPFDLLLKIEVQGECFRTSFVYNRNQLEPELLERMQTHYSTLLKSVLQSPETAVEYLGLLSDGETEQFLEGFNQTDKYGSPTDYPYSATVTELISEQAVRVPESVAVVGPDNRQLSYAELDSVSTRLARKLQAHGLQGGDRVGVYLERCVEMPGVLLAVMKSGACYIPLDPVFPEERLAFMAKDAGLKFVITQSSIQNSVPDSLADVLVIDELLRELDGISTQPLPQAQSDSLAYIIYTSGSTGLPKGVKITQGALVNFLCSMQQEPGFSENDRLLAVTTLSFDIAGLELYLPLITGGRLTIASREETVDPEKLASRISETGTTVMQATPATWKLLLDNEWSGDRRLRIFCGGEALPTELVDRLLPCSAELWNMYGPTETTIWSTVARIEHSDAITVGKPIANTNIYVLDDNQQLLPMGVTGELYIAGHGVAQGYLDRPELNASRFVNDPFAQQRLRRLPVNTLSENTTATHMYRTGDRARLLLDGRLDLCGRLDEQIKLRGYRIEPGEIRARIVAHATARDAIVVLREVTPGDSQLVAYVVGQVRTQIDISKLQQAIRAELPEYMVPGFWVELDALPLTPNGKVDVKNLPEPNALGTLGHPEPIEPPNKYEQQVADVWQRILGVPYVDTHSGFFELGGHSLLAVKLMSEMQKTLGIKVALMDLFHGITIKDIVQRMGVCLAPTGTHRSSCVRLTTATHGRPIFMVGSHPLYQRAAEQLDSEQPAYRLDAYALQAYRQENRLQICKTIEDIASELLQDMKSVQPEGPYIIGGGCEGALIAYELTRQLQSNGEIVAELLTWGTPAPGKELAADFGGSSLRRLWWQFQSVRAKGSIRALGWDGYLALIRHELVEHSLFSAMLKYAPNSRIDSGMHLVTLEPEEGDREYDEETMGWYEYTKDPVVITKLPGTHETWLRDHATTFGSYLESILKKTR